MEQIHQNLSMATIPEDGGDIVEGADAIVSNTSNQLLIVRTADCVPVLLADPTKKIISAVHAGRKSLTWGIIGEAIKSMKLLGAESENILAAIGPHIRVKNYEIGGEVVQHIGDSSYKNFIRDIDGKRYFDMTEAAFADLIEEDILLHNIEDCGIDTYEEYHRFFSHRRWSSDNKLYGGVDRRFASFIALE
jgi:YfiH family protein